MGGPYEPSRDRSRPPCGGHGPMGQGSTQCVVATLGAMGTMAKGWERHQRPMAPHWVGKDTLEKARRVDIPPLFPR